MRFDKLITPQLRRRMIDVAREFRKEPTPSEALLWQALRGRRLDGHKFRRQQPIGSFVVDFYCDEGALVIEIDSPIHDTQRLADHDRQDILESLCLRVLRIPAEVVERDIGSVTKVIRDHFVRTQTPLSPRERGRG